MYLVGVIKEVFDTRTLLGLPDESGEIDMLYMTWYLLTAFGFQPGGSDQ